MSTRRSASEWWLLRAPARFALKLSTERRGSLAGSPYGAIWCHRGVWEWCKHVLLAAGGSTLPTVLNRAIRVPSQRRPEVHSRA